MFAFMAHVMIKAKVVDDLFEMANTLVGAVKGGLGFATILSCTGWATGPTFRTTPCFTPIPGFPS
jgi:C4-dicarboxylate transporter DctM subunit